MEAFLSMANSGFLYILAGCVVVFVLILSLMYTLKAWRRGKELGISTEKMRSVVVNSATFSIVPSLAILLSLITMAGAFGVPLPWVRLSVVGSAPYELMSAELAMTSAGAEVGQPMDSTLFATVALVMTASISWGLLFLLFGFKRVSKRVDQMKNSDSKWGKVLTTALYMGMIAAFIGVSVAGIPSGDFVPFYAMAASALGMALCMLLTKRFKRMKWLDNFSLSFSMLLGMTTAVLTSL
ncbi:MAG: DUF5058 family protein [Clostridiales bacterium]|nr:DUF5058 family protein [Clostridiales bacterium]